MIDGPTAKPVKLRKWLLTAAWKHKWVIYKLVQLSYFIKIAKTTVHDYKQQHSLWFYTAVRFAIKINSLDSLPNQFEMIHFVTKWNFKLSTQCIS